MSAGQASEQAPNELAPREQGSSEQAQDEPLSYEQAREELIRVVQQLESGGVPLAESLSLWERGERLAQLCQDWLDGAQAKIDAARRPTSSGAEPSE